MPGELRSSHRTSLARASRGSSPKHKHVFRAHGRGPQCSPELCDTCSSNDCLRRIDGIFRCPLGCLLLGVFHWNETLILNPSKRQALGSSRVPAGSRTPVLGRRCGRGGEGCGAEDPGLRRVERGDGDGDGDGTHRVPPRGGPAGTAARALLAKPHLQSLGNDERRQGPRRFL